jgi:hypothetical protein
MIQEPRLRPPRNCLLWKAITTTVADELGVAQTFSEYSPNDFHEPSGMIIFALVKAEGLLIEIAKQVEDHQLFSNRLAAF